MPNQMERATAFKALHERDRPFLIPNPWDAGTTRLLESLGFEALATTSLGVSIMLGRHRSTAEQILDNVRLICGATSLPVNADLEDCFATEPKEAVTMITRAAEYGAVGGSIEDATFDANGPPVHGFDLAVERVHAAVEAARALPFPFMLTARAETLYHKTGGLDETIRRLKAYEAAGADVLYAPGLYSLEDIRTVVGELSKPLNLVMGFADPSLTLPQLADAGVKRISIGAGLSRIAMKSFLDSAKDMLAGQFGFVRDMAPINELRDAFGT